MFLHKDSFELAILPKLRPSDAQQDACNCLGLQTEALPLCHGPDAYVVVLTPLGVLREILWMLPHLCTFPPPPCPPQLLWISFRTVEFSSVQSLSHVQLFVTPWTAACQASLSITNSWNLLKLMSIKSVMPSNHLFLCHSPAPPAFNLSQHQGLFQGVSSSHQVAKVLEFQLQHQSLQ